MIERSNVTSMACYAKRKEKRIHHVVRTICILDNFSSPVTEALAKELGDFHKLYLLADETPDRVDDYEQGYLRNSTYYFRSPIDHRRLLNIHADELPDFEWHPLTPPTIGIYAPPITSQPDLFELRHYLYDLHGEMVELEVQLMDSDTGLLTEKINYRDAEMNNLVHRCNYHYNDDGLLSNVTTCDADGKHVDQSHP